MKSEKYEYDLSKPSVRELVEKKHADELAAKRRRELETQGSNENRLPVMEENGSLETERKRLRTESSITEEEEENAPSQDMEEVSPTRAISDCSDRSVSQAEEFLQAREVLSIQEIPSDVDAISLSYEEPPSDEEIPSPDEEIPSPDEEIPSPDEEILLKPAKGMAIPFDTTEREILSEGDEEIPSDAEREIYSTSEELPSESEEYVSQLAESSVGESAPESTPEAPASQIDESVSQVVECGSSVHSVGSGSELVEFPSDLEDSISQVEEESPDSEHSGREEEHE